MISSKQKTVYYSPARGRNFMTLNGACNAEAWTLVHNKYPTRDRRIISNYGDVDYGFKGYFKNGNHPAHFDDLVWRLARITKKRFIKEAQNG